MNTTLVIKTKKELRDDAKRVAQELGVPLTTVVNALLKQFVRDGAVTVSLEPTPLPAKVALWEEISHEARKGKTAKGYSNVEKLLSDLGIA
jgi:addiction module RelB/DinJ family antitoxin